jgi:ABC-2 type transport system permease protein/sodium transport system permease protein
MLLHAIHNGLLITLAHYEDWLVQFGFGASEQSHLPWLWILIAMVPASIGTAMLLFNQRRTPIPDRSTVVGSFD